MKKTITKSFLMRCSKTKSFLIGCSVLPMFQTWAFAIDKNRLDKLYVLFTIRWSDVFTGWNYSFCSF